MTSLGGDRLKRLVPVGAVLVVLSIALVYAGCQGAVQAPTKIVVKSIYTKQKMIPDGNAAKKFWRNKPATSIPTKGGPNVLMKSAYTSKEIYFFLQWNDPTLDNVSKVWQFDGTKWKNGLEQDKISILWDRNNSIAYFSLKGCQAICHTENPDKNLWYMATNRRQEKTDLWFWMAGISNVYAQVDDRFLDDSVDPEYMKAALKPDRGDAGFYKNGYKTPVEKIAPVRPTKKLIEGLSVEDTPYPLIQQMEDITSYKIFKAGDKEPFIYFSGPPSGSRADVIGKGVWSKGKWTLEISRKLDTTHKDDMPFRPDPSRSVFYMFGLAVFDHSEPPPIAHFTSPPISLELVPKK